MKKISISVLIIVVIGLVAMVAKNMYGEAERNVLSLQIVNNCLDGRACIYHSNELLIGNNEKELNNGYYDIKVEKVDNSLVFTINKLWYKKFSEKLWDEQYVYDLVEYIANVIFQSVNKQVSEKEEKELSEYIITEYAKAKENITFSSEFILDKMIILGSCKDFELVLELKII